MGRTGRFEELEVWKAARALVNMVYDLTDDVPFSRDFGLKDQIRRAVVSVLSNIAEGSERDTDADFCHFLVISKGSIGEVRSQLYIALDRSYITESNFQNAKSSCEQISRQLSHFITYLKKNQGRSALGAVGATKGGFAADAGRSTPVAGAIGATKGGFAADAGRSAPTQDLGPSTPRSGLGPSSPRSGLGPSTPRSGLGPSSPRSGLGPSTARSALGPSSPRSGLGPLTPPKAALDL